MPARRSALTLARYQPRHAAPRQPLRPGAVAVPAVLLAAGGGAFAGLAGVPAVSAEPMRASSASSVVQLASTDLSVTRAGSAVDVAAEAADQRAARVRAEQLLQQRARQAAADRATRARRALLDAQAKAKAVAAKEAAVAAAERKAALRERYARPADGPLTSPFGHRWGRLHAGLDFGAPYGSAIRAVMAGTIIDSGYNAGGYGNFVHVLHEDGAVTTYNHMSRILRRGGSVDAGDVLGYIGSTGHSTGPHLHFEVRIDDVPINPAPWLRARGIF